MSKTYTQKIFEENLCPWDNQYQGLRPRYLFVCSAGLLRSPTAAAIASKYGINARAAGSDPALALIPVNVHLLEWAHKIVFMNGSNKWQLQNTFQNDEYYLDLINSKAVVWDIEDDYEYFHPELIAEIDRRLTS